MRQSRTHGSDSRIDLRQISVESLPQVWISIGVLFLVFAVGDLQVLPRATAMRMSLAGAGAALDLFAVAISGKRSAIPPRGGLNPAEYEAQWQEAHTLVLDLEPRTA